MHGERIILLFLHGEEGVEVVGVVWLHHVLQACGVIVVVVVHVDVAHGFEIVVVHVVVRLVHDARVGIVGVELVAMVVVVIHHVVLVVAVFRHVLHARGIIVVVEATHVMLMEVVLAHHVLLMTFICLALSTL